MRRDWCGSRDVHRVTKNDKRATWGKAKGKAVKRLKKAVLSKRRSAACRTGLGYRLLPDRRQPPGPALIQAQLPAIRSPISMACCLTHDGGMPWSTHTEPTVRSLAARRTCTLHKAVHAFLVPSSRAPNTCPVRWRMISSSRSRSAHALLRTVYWCVGVIHAAR